VRACTCVPPACAYSWLESQYLAPQHPPPQHHAGVPKESQAQKCAQNMPQAVPVARTTAAQLRGRETSTVPGKERRERIRERWEKNEWKSRRKSEGAIVETCSCASCTILTWYSNMLTKKGGTLTLQRTMKKFHYLVNLPAEAYTLGRRVGNDLVPRVVVARIELLQLQFDARELLFFGS
jgi:hypothetical protein